MLPALVSGPRELFDRRVPGIADACEYVGIRARESGCCCPGRSPVCEGGSESEAAPHTGDHSVQVDICPLWSRWWCCCLTTRDCLWVCRVTEAADGGGKEGYDVAVATFASESRRQRQHSIKPVLRRRLILKATSGLQQLFNVLNGASKVALGDGNH
jgi:hypothetical protein